ncbi:hypothetical protein DES53_106151 [Roseimicrobium gellanilyticum]|uniref:Uncharacterized protein n=1 Tax=Roseimicrobium gellanilyticum TaxID=748857 RepID=A0A366HJM4_9BACT|nr:hypothetical protein [Roseimicrobium gellanilyticum]RBP42444.1 hypothetical protein DES53_106151 [Roseimicrobium gellanilyticum]
MNSPYFIGPWKGMGAAIEDCAEETGHSVAHLVRIGTDRVLQEYHTTGKVAVGAALRKPSRRGRKLGSKNATKGPTLDDLHRDAQEAREELNRLRAEWVLFCLQHGEEGKQRAKNGGPGVELWLCLKLAIERDAVAVERLAGARLALTPSGQR